MRGEALGSGGGHKIYVRSARRWRYRFGPFLYDAASHGLLRGGAEIPLTHKSRELLLLFLHNPGRLLTREEITEKVWPDVAVTDDAVRFQVAELRKAFAEEGGAYIRTIRRRGLSVGGPGEAGRRPARPPRGPDAAHRVRSTASASSSRVARSSSWKARTSSAAIPTRPSGSTTLRSRGGTPGSSIGGGKATLEDLESKNGTLLNGKKIEKRMALSDGDELRVGPETMVLRELSPATTQTERKT